MAGTEHGPGSRKAGGAVVAFVLAIALLGANASLGAGRQPAGRGRPLRVAQSDPLADRKKAFLLPSEREVETLASKVSQLARITPASGDPSSGFSEAARAFNDKAAVVQAKLDAVRASADESTQSSIGEAEAALEELRAAYGAVVEAAK